jgi:hypothetical protein
VAHIFQPTLELRLAPPKHPQPQVVAELAVLDAARDKLEARLLKELTDKYESALDNAKSRIDALIKRSFGAAHFNARKRAGFLRVAERNSSPAGFGIKVKLFPVPTTDASIQARMDDLEHKLSTTEWSTLHQAVEDFPRITEVVVNELATEINTGLKASANARAHASFLELPSLAIWGRIQCHGFLVLAVRIVEFAYGEVSRRARQKCPIVRRMCEWPQRSRRSRLCVASWRRWNTAETKLSQRLWRKYWNLKRN